MRRYEIDWIRNISILLLFIYHTSAIFCQFGDFYIVSEQTNIFANIFILLLFVWYMPMLFFLAGASTYFALEKRSLKDYLQERIKRLLIPILFGIIVLIPPQTYLARLWRGESNLNYFEHLRFFFTNIGDFTGFDGGFTPAHLWFIAYLFIVSVIGGIIISKIFKSSIGTNLLPLIKKVLLSKLSIPILLLMGFASDIFPSIMGKSIVGCLTIFILGYIIYQDHIFIEKIKENRYKFLFAFIFTGFIGIIYALVLREEKLSILSWVVDGLLKNIVLISAISSIIGFSSIYLNKNSRVLKYLNKSAFPIYIIHQTILLLIAFFVVPIVKSTTWAMLIIILFSALFTFAVYELLKNIKIFNVLLGMK